MNYSIALKFSEEDNGWVAHMPELNVFAFGDTQLEAIEEIDIAKRLALEIYEADGVAFPEPHLFTLEEDSSDETPS